MTLRHKDVPAPSRQKTFLQPKSTQSLHRWSLLAAAVILTLVTLACAFLGSSSRSAPDRIVVRKRLPTLTRTPLPTLTPTPPPVTMSTEAGVTSSIGVPTSTVISSSQTAPLAAEPAVTSAPPVPPPAVTPANSDTSASLATGNQGSSGPLLTALVGLNVRAGPGLDYATVGQLVQGQSVQVIGKTPDGTWWQIIYPPGSGSPGWVSADAQYSTASSVEAVQIAQLPPPAPPTATPTPLPTVPATPTPLPTNFPTNVPDGQSPTTPTPSSSGTPAAGPTETPMPGPPGWAFASVRVYPDQEDSLLLMGDMINNTGASQELAYVTGTFYDDQGQVIADKDHTFDTWPIDTIPPGGRVPFELTVDGIQNAANFDLNVEAEPSDKMPRQDFEFLDVNQSNDDGYYCIEGKLRNPGSELQSYLTIVAVLYDAQDNVVNFNTLYKPYPEDLVGDETLHFETCVDSLNQEAVRHELRAWGL